MWEKIAGFEMWHSYTHTHTLALNDLTKLLQKNVTEHSIQEQIECQMCSFVIIKSGCQLLVWDIFWFEVWLIRHNN